MFHLQLAFDLRIESAPASHRLKSRVLQISGGGGTGGWSYQKGFLRKPRKKCRHIAEARIVAYLVQGMGCRAAESTEQQRRLRAKTLVTPEGSLYLSFRSGLQNRLFTGNLRTGNHSFRLLYRLIEFLHPVLALQHLARSRAVRRAHNSVFFHDVDQMRRAAVADAQAPL